MAQPKQFERRLHQRWGKRLRSARQSAGLSQTQLAKRLRIHQGRVSEWESGDRVPSDATKFRLARVLDRSLDDLFGWPEFLPEEDAA